LVLCSALLQCCYSDISIALCECVVCVCLPMHVLVVSVKNA